MKPCQALDVREHQFLAATDGVAYTFRRVQGVANLLFGGASSGGASSGGSSSGGSVAGSILSALLKNS